VPRIIWHITFILIFITVFSIFMLTVTPWIQTAFGNGVVTAIDPSERVQNVTAQVKGRIKNWYVYEGDIVKAGEPLVEIVDNDMNLIQRLTDQRNAYQSSYNAIRAATQTARLNYQRQQKLYTDGLSSKLDVEKSKIDYEKYISEQQKSQVMLQQSETKLSQQSAQIITAPRDGMIVKITAGNLATSVKVGDILATLVPSNIEPAVALYMHGIDIALIYAGRKVRLQFEGWPSVQFSGWPSTAIGTFGGVVASVDPMVSMNGRFRILVKPDPDDKPWPKNRYLHYGARVKGYVLLEKVKLAYEFWRQLNAFPPEYVANPKADDGIRKSKKFKK
jgi:multidrug efflux pump subunit AcrA (membrane-fusion protein)